MAGRHSRGRHRKSIVRKAKTILVEIAAGMGRVGNLARWMWQEWGRTITYSASVGQDPYHPPILTTEPSGGEYAEFDEWPGADEDWATLLSTMRK